MPVSSGDMRSVVHAIAFGAQPRLALQHARWWDDPNVVGLCYAPKVRRGREEDRALQVLVRTKRSPGRVPAHRRVPPSIDLRPLGLRGKVATDVREVGRSRLEVLIGQERPVRPGFNIGHRRGGSGTLACAVRSLDTGERLGLSCAHVIARHGRALPGERVLVPSLDEARALELLWDAPFGSLVRVGPIGFGFDQARSNVDAATVRPDDPAALDNQLARLDVRPSALRDEVALGLMVQKVGSATELTFGRVEAEHLVLSLPFQDDRGLQKEVWFADLLGITRFTAAGDSGALVLDLEGRAVGLHLGGFQGLSVCMPIRRVLESLRCELDVTQGPSTRPAPPPVA
jgi:hypothetical protein